MSKGLGRRFAARLRRLLFGSPAAAAETQFMAGNRRYFGYEIGEWSYGFPAVLQSGEGSTLQIGRFCSIANGVTILLGGDHRVDWITTYPFSVFLEEARARRGHPRSKGSVVIGHDVWIGLDATILSGVTIGNGAVVGACSVVTRSVPPFAIVAGNPARHVRYRFAEEQIRALEEIAWWSWPIERIKGALPMLLSDDLDGFLEKYRTK